MFWIAKMYCILPLPVEIQTIVDDKTKLIYYENIITRQPFFLKPCYNFIVDIIKKVREEYFEVKRWVIKDEDFIFTDELNREFCIGNEEIVEIISKSKYE